MRLQRPRVWHVHELRRLLGSLRAGIELLEQVQRGMQRRIRDRRAVNRLAQRIKTHDRQMQQFLGDHFTRHRHALGIQQAARAAARGVKLQLRALQPRHGDALRDIERQAAVVIAGDAHAFHLRQAFQPRPHFADAQREQIRVLGERRGADDLLHGERTLRVHHDLLEQELRVLFKGLLPDHLAHRDGADDADEPHRVAKAAPLRRCSLLGADHGRFRLIIDHMRVRRSLPGAESAVGGCFRAFLDRRHDGSRATGKTARSGKRLTGLKYFIASPNAIIIREKMAGPDSEWMPACTRAI